jgi:MtfA peptidase
MLSLFRRWSIRRLLRQRLDRTQMAVLREHVHVYQRLSSELQRRLEQIVVVMREQCHWEGCEGLMLADDMRTRIAGHAAVMLLGANDYYFETVSAILVFPDDIRRIGDSDDGPTVGEAWDNGGVVISWPEVLRIGKDRDGENVVIHEFAHHLDGLDGEMGGSIPFTNEKDQSRWDRVASEEFERLVRDIQRGRPTLLDPYGATNRAEFFAVCSECFFEQSKLMHQAHPELFDLLRRFYQIDPLQWND